MEKSPRTQNFEANKTAVELDEAHQMNEEFDAAKAAERDAFENDLFGDATDFTDTDQNPDAEYPEQQRNAKTRGEEANAYERHLERIAKGLDRQEEIYNKKPSAALKRDSDMWNDALTDDEAFDTTQNEAAQAEAEVADAAFEAKLAASPQLRRMDMISQELHDVDNKRKSLESQTFDDENEASLSAELDALNARSAELDIKLLELNKEYKNSDAYDENIENVLLDRSDMDSLDKAAKIALAEQRAVEQEAAEAKKPRAGEENLVHDYNDAEDEARIWDADTVPAPIVRKMPLATVTQLQAQRPQDRIDPDRIATTSVNGEGLAFNPKYKSESESSRLERLVENIDLKGAWVKVREGLKNRERGAGGRKKALAAFAILGVAVGGGFVARAMMNNEAPERATAETSAPSASPEAQVKPTSVEAKAANNEILNSTAWNIPKGSGGEKLMNRLGADEDVWYKYEDGFLKKFPGEAYRMSDGHVGLSDPGKLPTEAIKFWADKVQK